MSDDFKVQISYKLGPNNSDMLNVRAESVGELDSLLEALNEEGASTIQAIVSTGAQIRASGNAAPLLGQQPQAGPPEWAAPPQQQAQVPQQRLSPSGQACQHGTYVWAEGISKKTGKPYKMWKCPQPGTDCKPSFA